MAALVLGAVWVARPDSLGWPPQAKLAMLAGGLVALIALIALLSRRIDVSLEPLLEPLRRLSETCLDQLADESTNLPTDSVDNKKFAALLSRVRERMCELAQVAAQNEHLRAGVEVRSRRTAEERDKLREILRQLVDPVLAVDPFGELILANPAAEKALRIETHDPQIRSLERLISRHDIVEMLHEARRRRGGTQRTSEIELEDESGRKHWYRIACRGLSESAESDESGRPALHGAVAVLTDISSQKAIQKRNAEFVSAVSHEMKTPLASIRAYVELLADGEAEDEASREEFLGIIQSQADRLQRLIDNLLNLARIEAGVVQVQKEPRSLNELLGEAVNLLQPSADAKQISLAAELSPMYLGVLADRDTLLQGAINLISNAVKYTPNGGKITVRSRLDGQEVIFEVQDTGVGLSEQDRQKVFEKFYRVKKDQQMAAGTGLGLPLVKHIVEDVHSGRVELDSELGRGSTFRVLLPALHQLSA